MKAKHLVLALLISTALLSGNTYPGTIIANPALSVSPIEIFDIFTGEKQIIGGVKVVPVDNAAAQAVFVKSVLNMDVAKYQTRWIKKSFQDGMNAPPVKGSDAEVAAFVKSTPGAIGYVEVVPDGVKVIHKY